MLKKCEKENDLKDNIWQNDYVAKAWENKIM